MNPGKLASLVSEGNHGRDRQMSPAQMAGTVILALATVGVGCDFTEPDTRAADELEGVWIGQITRADSGLDGARIRMDLTTTGTHVTGSSDLDNASGPVTGSFTFPDVDLVLTYEALDARCTMDGNFTRPYTVMRFFNCVMAGLPTEGLIILTR